MKFKFIFFLFTFGLISVLFGQDPIRYSVDLSNIQHHEIEISIHFPSLPLNVLEIRMPQSSPGRYAVHNFAKNVYEEKATDPNGNALYLHRKSPTQWTVAGHQGEVIFKYTLYANHGDGTYSGVDNRKLHLNMPATFAYGVGMEHRPVELQFDLSNHPTWSVASQLKSLSKDRHWAPNYYYFFDSPTFVGDIDFRRWTSTSNGKEYTIEVAMIHEGTDKELDDYAEWVKKVVEEQKAVYGELPDFDFGRYTFLCAYNPWVFGDGMEHRNSTVCSSQASLEQAAGGLIGTISHEFFHCWNVERIRPKSLEPFDFDRANMSGELWFAEGFTSYYTGLILARAGIRTPEQYIQSLNGNLNYVYSSPGREFRSPIQMSQNAPFVDAATSIDENNYGNNFISYYSYGAILGLVLDLSLRTEFENINLDDYMKAVWQQFGKTEIPYQVRDLQKVLTEVTSDEAFASNFFSKYIYEGDLPDAGELLGQFGIVLKAANEGKTQVETLNVSYTDQGAKINSNINRKHSLYPTGINKGDIILAINGKNPTDEDGFGTDFEIGKVYKIKYLQNGIEYDRQFFCRPDPSASIHMLEAVGGKPTKEMLEKRNKWLKRE